MKKRKIKRDGFEAFRSGRAQQAPGKRTATEERYRKAELAEEVPQQTDLKPAAKRDANKPDPNKPASATEGGAAPADPALAQPQQEAESKPDVTPEKDLAPSFLPVFDVEPDAEKE